METNETTLSSLLINWLRGANTAQLQNLSVHSWNRGTGLFLGREVSSRRTKPGTLIATLEGGVLRVFTMHDFLGIKKFAKKLGVPVVNFTEADFRDNGFLDGKAFK